eukprot:6201184-Pleurochrysis_carterae.AAC.1
MREPERSFTMSTTARKSEAEGGSTCTAGSPLVMFRIGKKDHDSLLLHELAQRPRRSVRVDDMAAGNQR